MMVGKKAVFTVVIISLMAASSLADKYSGGDGEPNNPYRIATPNDLNDIGNHPEDFNKCFVMVEDVNLADYTGTQFNIIGSWEEHFTGVFDGNGHNILNFSYQGNSSIGLFSHVGEDWSTTGEIKNLRLVEPNVGGGTGAWVGALAGSLYSGTISGCFVRGGHIRGDYCVGGLIGRTPLGFGTKIIADCCSTATVSDGDKVGGLAGWFAASKGEGLLLNCSSSGSVSGDDDVGGLVGDFHGYVSACHSSATVSGNERVGALIGSATSKPYYFSRIVQCSAVGDVTGGYKVGGLVGRTFDCNLTDCNAGGIVIGAWHVGGLTGEGDGKFTNCYYTGSVSGIRAVGGLAGTAYGTITDCWADADVSAYDCVGGLVGYNYSTIGSSYATGEVNCASLEAGGLVGCNEQGVISNCSATGGVSAHDVAGGLVGCNDNGSMVCSYAAGDVNCGVFAAGGLCGDNYYGAMSNCYSTGSVSGHELIGGLVGSNSGGSIVNCYAVGAVTGNDVVGGLVGQNRGAYTKCFWDIEVNPDVNGIGNTTDPNVIGKTTAEMQTEGTFTDAGWDFVGAWNIGEKQTYPFLRVYPAGDIDHDDRVNFLDFAILAEHWLEEK